MGLSLQGHRPKEPRSFAIPASVYGKKDSVRLMLLQQLPPKPQLCFDDSLMPVLPIHKHLPRVLQASLVQATKQP